MAKVSQVLQNLEKNIQTQEEQITEIYKKKAEELEKNLINEWKETQRRIEKNIQLHDEELLKECNRRKNWIWLVFGMLAGEILTIIAVVVKELIKG